MCLAAHWLDSGCSADWEWASPSVTWCPLGVREDESLTSQTLSSSCSSSCSTTGSSVATSSSLSSAPASTCICESRLLTSCTGVSLPPVGEVTVATDSAVGSEAWGELFSFFPTADRDWTDGTVLLAVDAVWRWQEARKCTSTVIN